MHKQRKTNREVVALRNAILIIIHRTLASDNQNADITVSATELQNVNRHEFLVVSVQQTPDSVEVYSSFEGTREADFYSEQLSESQPEQTTTAIPQPIEGWKDSGAVAVTLAVRTAPLASLFGLPLLAFYCS